jgi:hypothetical protein
MADSRKMRILSTSFSEEKEAKRLFYPGAWAFASSRPWPRTAEVFCFFFSKKKFLA